MTEYYILRIFKIFIPFDIGFSFQESTLSDYLTYKDRSMHKDVHHSVIYKSKLLTNDWKQYISKLLTIGE